MHVKSDMVPKLSANLVFFFFVFFSLYFLKELPLNGRSNCFGIVAHNIKLALAFGGENKSPQ